jgi:hypothetical protein
MDAGKGEILKFGRASVLSRNDVVGVDPDFETPS